MLTTTTLFKVDSNTGRGDRKYAVCNQEKNTRRREFHNALFFSVQPKHPHPTAEKDIWPEKNTGGRERRQRKLLNSVFEKTLMVCQRKEGCAALNHKSFSRLCQISSTLQALKRNKETLLFGSPFLEDDRKLKGAQINLKMRTKCGVAPGCQTAAPGGTLRGREAPPPRAPAAAGCERKASNCSPRLAPRTATGHPALTKLPRQGPPGTAGPGRKEKRQPLLPGLAPIDSGTPSGGREVSEERGSGPPPPPSRAAPRQGRRGEKNRHLNPGASGGARRGQTRRRNDPGERRGRQPVGAPRGAAAEWH